MGVDQPFEASPVQHFADQLDGLGGVRDVAAINQRGIFTLKKKDVIG